MWSTNKHLRKQDAFTIVELLIVIVVIGILAAISIVAYNGMQNRAKNTKTTQAFSAWVDALRLYKTDNGRWPNAWTCLGEDYKYGPSGSDTSGTSQCRNGYTASTTINNIMRPYFNGGSLPTPAFVTAYSSETEWRRGLHYVHGGGNGELVYVNAAFAGELSACPEVRGYTGTRNIWNGNTMCHYNIGLTTDT